MLELGFQFHLWVLHTTACNFMNRVYNELLYYSLLLCLMVFFIIICQES